MAPWDAQQLLRDKEAIAGATRPAGGALGLAYSSANNEGRAVAEGHAVATVTARHENIGSVSSRRVSVLPSAIVRWFRRGSDTAVAPRLETVVESERRPMLPSVESPDAGSEESATPLVGAETHRRVVEWKQEEEMEEGGGRKEEEGLVEEKEAGGKGKEQVDVKQVKPKEGMEEAGVEDTRGAQAEKYREEEEKEEDGEEEQVLEEGKGVGMEAKGKEHYREEMKEAGVEDKREADEENDSEEEEKEEEEEEEEVLEEGEEVGVEGKGGGRNHEGGEEAEKQMEVIHNEKERGEAKGEMEEEDEQEKVEDENEEENGEDEVKGEEAIDKGEEVGVGKEKEREWGFRENNGRGEEEEMEVKKVEEGDEEEAKEKEEQMGKIDDEKERGEAKGEEEEEDEQEKGEEDEDEEEEEDEEEDEAKEEEVIDKGEEVGVEEEEEREWEFRENEGRGKEAEMEVMKVKEKEAKEEEQMDVNDDEKERGEAKEEEEEEDEQEEGGEEEEEEEEGEDEAKEGEVIDKGVEVGLEEEKEREWGFRENEGGGEEGEMEVNSAKEDEEEEEEGEKEEEEEEMEEEEEEEEEEGDEEDEKDEEEEEEEEEEDEDEDDEEEEEEEESVAADGYVPVSAVVFESSAIVDNASEASGVASDVASGVDEQSGSLVPAEFRPSGSEDDVLHTWSLSMVRTKEGAAILGKGSFGSVAEVRTEKSQELAMKTVIKFGSSPSRIQAETDLLQECCAHPHVVDLHGFINTRDRMYLIMSKADTTLLSMTKGGSGVDEARAVQCIRQLVSAVAFLHDRLIIHHDIKPANVLLRNGEVLLADFGLAVRTKDGPSAQTGCCGTQLYMAPELISGMPHGLAVDMWATGVVAFELLHGEHPFWPNDKEIVLPARSGSYIDVGEDAGPVLGVGGGGRVGGGDGALSSWAGVGSTGVRVVVGGSLPPLPPSMSASGSSSGVGGLDVGDEDDEGRVGGGGGALSSGAGVDSAGARAVLGGSLTPLPPSMSAGGSFVDGSEIGDVGGEGGEGRVGGGGGALSSGVGEVSAGVRAVLEGGLPPLPPSMSASQDARDIFRNNVKNADFNVKEGLESHAEDFLDQLLHLSPSHRMSAAEAAEHEWLNRNSPEDHAARRSDTRAQTIIAMAAKRALRLDAAVFKAHQAVEAVGQLDERVQGSSAFFGEPSLLDVSVAAAKATGDVLSTLHECAQRVKLAAAEAYKAKRRVESWEAEIAAGNNTCAPSGMQLRGELGVGVRIVGPVAEHKANESVWKAEMCARQAETCVKPAEEAVEAWEGRLAVIAEEVEAAKVAEALYASLRHRRNFREEKGSAEEQGDAEAVR